MFQHLGNLIRQIRWRALLVITLLVASGVIEGAGLLLLVPLLGAIGLDVQQGPVGRLSALVTGAFNAVGLALTLPRVLIVFVAINAALAWLKRMQTALAGAVEQDVVHAARVRLYRSILRMEWLALCRMRASDLTAALTTECERAGLAASQLLTIAGTSVVTLVYVAVASRLSLPITAGVFACGLVLTMLLRRRTRLSETLGAAFSDATRDFQAAVSDDLGGLKTIRGYGAEARSLGRFDAVSHRLGDVRTRNIRAYAASTFWLETGSAAMLSALVLIAVRGLQFQASALLLLVFLFARVMPRLAAMQQNVQYYRHVLPSVGRVDALQQQCDAASEPERAASPIGPLHDAVHLRNVSFRYADDLRYVLDGIDLTIRAGTVAAIVGPSGVGKTTLVDVLLGLVRPESGSLEIDGRALDAADAARWRTSIAYVPQETFLFHGTIRANLQWAAPDATESDVWAALDTAAAGFVRSLPAQLDTVVGDRGTMLSGGERQRLALARALLRRPSLLVLDEATSAVDGETETRILDVIGTLRGSLTVVIVTHRLQSVRSADVIHVLEGGRIVESGRWGELIDRPTGRLQALLGRDAVSPIAPAL